MYCHAHTPIHSQFGTIFPFLEGHQWYIKCCFVDGQENMQSSSGFSRVLEVYSYKLQEMYYCGFRTTSFSTIFQVLGANLLMPIDLYAVASLSVWIQKIYIPVYIWVLDVLIYFQWSSDSSSLHSLCGSSSGYHRLRNYSVTHCNLSQGGNYRVKPSLPGLSWTET